MQSGIATPAVLAIERHLAGDGQVLVFLNRRGYAPTLLCTACGWIAPCSECDARLTVHQASGRLRCHHCGADAAAAQPLPAVRLCGESRRPGHRAHRGSARGELFPRCSIARLDRDVVRRRGDLEAVVARMVSGDARILVGTQMVTKGHDFPNVTLVVVLNADQGLFSTDFRAPERLAQTIVQVAGRAGRGNKPGEVLIQTEFPEHPLLQRLLSEGYDGLRAARRSPSASRRSGRRLRAWPRCATRPRRARRRSASSPRRARSPGPGARAVRLLGPVPAAMAERAGRYHAQLLIESAERTRLHPSSTAGCRRSSSSRVRARCAGRSTSIRSSCSSRCRLQGRKGGQSRGAFR